MTAQEILEREFLGMRARILELASSLDRIDRASGDVTDTGKRELIKNGIGILARPGENRAEQVQLLFSQQYLENWVEDFGMDLAD